MKKLSALILIASLLMLIFASCSFFPSADRDDDNKSTTPIKIGYMNGPTGMGMAKLINDNGGVDGNDKYQFVKYSDASLATADLLSGKLDMACIPTNTAAGPLKALKPVRSHREKDVCIKNPVQNKV